MIGDRAYDSDPLDQKLQEQHRIELIAPHKGICFNCFSQRLPIFLDSIRHRAV
jgi:hypothetical protein